MGPGAARTADGGMFVFHSMQDPSARGTSLIPDLITEPNGLLTHIKYNSHDYRLPAIITDSSATRTHASVFVNLVIPLDCVGKAFWSNDAEGQAVLKSGT
jgi:hypothetical protein